MLRNASDTALAMAAGGAMAPPSPRPLTPYSVACAGCTRCAMRTVGTSGAQGTMYSPNDVASGWPIVVRDFLVERGADALRDAALDLAVDHHRVDHGAAVFGHGVVEDFDDAGVGLDGNDDGVSAIGEHAAGFRRLISAGHVEQRLHAGRQVFLPDVRRIGDLGKADAAGGTVHRAGFDLGVADVGL